MAQKSRSDLLIQANVIKNETVANRNTQVRVGTMNIDEIDSSININDTEPSTWYVHSAPKGDDSNVGSDKFPFKTLQVAIDAAISDDIIIIQSLIFDSNVPITIDDKMLSFIGNIPDGHWCQVTFRNTWTITGSIRGLVFENIIASMALDVSGTTTIEGFHSSIGFSSTTDRLVILFLNDCTFVPAIGAEFKTIKLKDIITGKTNTNPINIGLSGEIINSQINMNVEAGIDIGGLTFLIKNSSLSRDLTIDGNLIKENSTVGGTEDVSGTITPISQADDKLDRLSTSDQTVASNVAFEKQVRGGSSTVAFSATKTFSMDNGNFQKMPVTAAITSLAISDDLNGHAYWIMLEIGGAGSYTIPQAGATFGTRTDNSVDDSVASWFPTTVGSKIMYTIARDPDGEKIYSIETITA